MKDFEEFKRESERNEKIFVLSVSLFFIFGAIFCRVYC